jgi:cupin 2 domain-containing protein
MSVKILDGEVLHGDHIRVDGFSCAEVKVDCMMGNFAGNIFANLPLSQSEEIFQEIIQGKGFSLERIISFGQSTPVGQWYDQEQHEWVVLLSGAAGLRFEGEEGLRVLHPGDFVNIPAHTRHRVEWTDEKQNTVWLALHYSKSEAAR